MHPNCWKFLYVVLLLFVTGCSSSEGESLPKASIENPKTALDKSPTSGDSGHVEPVTLTAEDASTQSPARAVEKPEVVIHTTMGQIRVRLNVVEAPRTVNNFLDNYVERDFYAGTSFHYVEKGVMIVAGGYDAELQPKQVRAAILNEADNKLSNKRGTIAMARHADYPHSATSQFFINLNDNTSLDFERSAAVSTTPSSDDEPAALPEVNGYCVFGEVIEGMDVVDKIAAVEVEDRDSFNNTPRTVVVINRIERVK